MLHMQGEAKKRTQEEELKRRRRDEECPEEVAELQVWDGTNLLDDGVQSVNAALRTKLRGPFGDPATWFRGDFLTEKVTPVLGNVVHTRHLLGSDRVNPKAIRLLHSRASIVELKVRYDFSRYNSKLFHLQHFSSTNAGVTRSLDQEQTLGHDAESGEQVIQTRVKWAELKDMYELVDTLYNRLAINMLVRPWDYGWFAAMRAYHRARMFQEVAGSEKKQLEMGKVKKWQ